MAIGEKCLKTIAFPPVSRIRRSGLSRDSLLDQRLPIAYRQERFAAFDLRKKSEFPFSRNIACQLSFTDNIINMLRTNSSIRSRMLPPILMPAAM